MQEKEAETDTGFIQDWISSKRVSFTQVPSMAETVMIFLGECMAYCFQHSIEMNGSIINLCKIHLFFFFFFCKTGRKKWSRFQFPPCWRFRTDQVRFQGAWEKILGMSLMSPSYFSFFFFFFFLFLLFSGLFGKAMSGPSSTQLFQ